MNNEKIYQTPDERETLEDRRDDMIQGTVMLGGVRVSVASGLKDITVNEAVNYVDFVEKQKRTRSDRLTEIRLSPADDGNIRIDWTLRPLPFNRIRRITGYLVGDLDRWNSAKRAEERDRVKHVSAWGR